MVAGAMPVLAQEAGTFEGGAFGRYTHFESKLNFDNRLGVGAFLGVFFYRNLALEGDVTYTRTKSQGGAELRQTPLHARLVYHFPVDDRAALLVGAGYVRNLFRASYRETESGIGGLVGGRYGLGRGFSVRVNVTGDYIPTAESRFVPPQLAGIEYKKSNFHLGIEAGVSVLVGRKGG
jgi:hypothetical protein